MSDFDMNGSNVVDTMKETDKKCPDCGGTMDFDPKTGGLLCPYCGHTEAIPEVKGADGASINQTVEETSLEDAEKTANCDWGVATKTVLCKSCGAESVYDKNDISATCPYCGSNQVMEANDTDTMAPGGVVPFKIDEKEASQRFNAWLKGKFFAPKAAKESAKAKNFKGMYLPFWTFDTETRSKYTGEYGKDRKVKKNDKEEIVTDWYKTNGVYDEFFDDELVTGTTKHEEWMLNGIAPYNTADNKLYKPEYVAGFGAERYSVGVKDAWEKAKNIIKNKLHGSISNKITTENHADHVRNLDIKTTFNKVTFKYLLLPVWVANYKYNDKVYQFMVNGQTGKVSGRSPISAIKVIITVLVVIAIIALLYAMFGSGSEVTY